VGLMFEHEVASEARISCVPGESVLSLTDAGAEHGRIRFEGLDLNLRAGETIGLAGMEGSGQRLLLRACAGLAPTFEGRIALDRSDATGKNYLAFKKMGVAYVPASRLEEGLVPGMSLTDHFLLTDHERGFFVNRREGRRLAQDRISDFNIRGRPEDRIDALSGGNQQRALLALLRPGAKLILLEHPTRGLDLESVIYLWTKLKARCNQGAAIMFASSDLEEILRYSDRILVFFAGRVTGPLDATSTTVDQLGRLIGGAPASPPSDTESHV